MRIKLSILLIPVLASMSRAQNFGNSSLLKYRLTPNQIAADVNFYGFYLSSSPAKHFLLKNATTTGFSAIASVQPLADMAAESSGELLNIKYPTMQGGLSFGYSYTTYKQQQGFLSFNRAIKLKKKTPLFRVQSYFTAGKQSLTDDRRVNSWMRNDDNATGYIKLTNFNYNRKNSFGLQGYGIMNRGGVDNEMASNFRDNGNLFMLKLNWVRKVSANHVITSTANTQHFTQRVSPSLCLSCDAVLDYNAQHFQVEDVIKLKNSKFVNIISYSDNNQRLTSRGANLNGYYSLGMWQTKLTRYTKEDKIGVTYNHGLGAHSSDGLVFNPGIRLFGRLQILLYDFGFNTFSRTPALLTEFNPLFLPTSINEITTGQERWNKIFATSKFRVRDHMAIEFKYIQSASPNKWLFNPELKTLTQQEIRYSSFYLQLNRSLYRNFRFMLLYRNITPETKSAEILAKHYLSGTYEFNLYNQYKKLLKQYRRFNISVELKTAYLSEHNLPFNENGRQAMHKGGVFADGHLKLRLGKNSYYYNRSSDPLRLHGAVIRFGLNNILNTRSTLQPIQGNNFKPIMPRQVFAGLSLDF